MLDRHECLLVFARFQEHVHHAPDAGMGPGGAAPAEAQLSWPVEHQVLSGDAELHPTRWAMLVALRTGDARITDLAAPSASAA